MQIATESRHPLAKFWVVRLSVMALVEGDDPVTGVQQGLTLEEPVPALAGIPMNKHDRMTVALVVVDQPNTIGGGE